MATFLFWNINKKNNIHDIGLLCEENDVDVLILAESDIPDAELIMALNQSKKAGLDSFYIFPFSPSERLKIYIRYPQSALEMVYDEYDGRVVVRRLIPPIGTDIILVGVHLPSQMYDDEKGRMLFASRVIEIIDEAETKIGHDKTMVIGDFNMNPFEAGMAGSDCFHAVMDRKIAAEKSRVVKYESKKYFYNPMWGFFGDNTPGPSGTYFYRGSMVSYFWNVFDQVLLRPDLLDYFSSDRLAVISHVGGKELNLREKAGPDHFPIMVTLDIEKEE